LLQRMFGLYKQKVRSNSFYFCLLDNSVNKNFILKIGEFHLHRKIKVFYKVRYDVGSNSNQL
jgi:hypothetical protein